MIFEREYITRWADLDPNGHLRHSAYADYAAQVRLNYFKSLGFSFAEMMARGIGPILFREELKYLREVRMEENIRITCELGSMSPDGRKWTMIHQIYKPDGEKAAHIVVDGSWLDLVTRRVTTPPAELVAALSALTLHVT